MYRHLSTYVVLTAAALGSLFPFPHRSTRIDGSLLPVNRLSAQTTTIQVEAPQFPAQAEWLEKWDNSLKYSLETLSAVKEEDLDFRPTEQQMSLREQLQHMATNMYFLTARYVQQPPGFDLAAVRKSMNATADKAAVEQTLRDAYAFAAKACSSLPQAEWEAVAPDFFAGPKTKRAILYLIQDHATHHRAQTLVYLRLLGRQPPAYRGW